MARPFADAFIPEAVWACVECNTTDTFTFWKTSALNGLLQTFHALARSNRPDLLERAQRCHLDVLPNAVYHPQCVGGMHFLLVTQIIGANTVGQLVMNINNVVASGHLNIDDAARLPDNFNCMQRAWTPDGFAYAMVFPEEVERGLFMQYIVASKFGKSFCADDNDTFTVERVHAYAIELSIAGLLLSNHFNVPAYGSALHLRLTSPPPSLCLCVYRSRLFV